MSQRTTPDRSAAPQGPDPLLGQVVAGRMRILDRIHSGTRSRIYEVEPPGVGEVRWALKLLTAPEAREPEVFDRLQLLADVDRGISDPHVERIYGCGRLSDDTPYLCTEWLPLPSLAQVLLIEGGVDRSRALQTIEAAASGLAALHARGLVHGELRPDHILVQPGVGGFDRVVLVDVGVDAALDTRPARNLEGALAYRAPERLDGGLASASSDIYALGVLAWQLLAGPLPFRPDDLRAAGVDPDPAERLRWLHRHAAPLRPSLAGGALVPGPLEAVIGQALAKDPADRFRDGAAFLAAWDRARVSPEGRDDGAAWYQPRPIQASHPALPQQRLGPPSEPVIPAPLPPPGLVPWLAAGLACGAVCASALRLLG